MRSIEHITKAMKMVSAARARRATERIVAALPYAIRMRRLLRRIVLESPESAHTLLRPHESPRDLYVVYTGERGLCGACNANVIKEWETHRRATNNDADLIAIGRWGIDYFHQHATPMALAYISIGEEAVFEEARVIGTRLMDLYQEKNYRAVYLVYTRFINTLVRQVTTFKLLPFESSASSAEEYDEYVFEPNPADLFAYLLPKYVTTQLAAAYLDSRASEFAARMMAMDTATQNAEELIHKLTLQFNRARQAGITQEIAEIVGGTLGSGEARR